VPTKAPSNGPMVLKTNDMVVESSTGNVNAIPAFRIESIDVSSRNGRDFVRENQDYLYDRAFSIAPWSSPTLTDTFLCECYRTETCAVLMFNTALAYHQRGMLVGTGDGLSMQRHLTNAEATYHLILNMIAADGASLIPATTATDTDTDTETATASSICVWWSQRHPSLAVLSMAVSNNLTHIYLERLDQALMHSSRALLRTMLQQITWTVQIQQEEAKAQHLSQYLYQQQESNVNNIIHLEDFTFFHLNLFCLERENFGVSPAA
jgi:hypothetical protein